MLRCSTFSKFFANVDIYPDWGNILHPNCSNTHPKHTKRCVNSQKKALNLSYLCIFNTKLTQKNTKKVC